MYSPYPDFIDLVPEMQTNPYEAPPNQTGYNACQTYAVAIALEAQHKRAGAPIKVNRSALYYMAKMFSMGGAGGNNGASVSAVGQALAIYGVPTHPTYHDMGDMYTPPPKEVFDQAALYKGVVVETIPYIRSGAAKDNTIETLHMMFARGYGAIFTFRLNESFDNNAGGYWDWKQTNWDGSYATGGSSRGDHVVTGFGIDMASQRVLAANHWGEYWGDGGFFGIPFDKFLQGPQGCVTQIHFIKVSAVNAVGVPYVNAIPTSLTPTQQNKHDLWIKQELLAAFNSGGGGNWVAALLRGVALGLSDKQFEMHAPALGGLPRGTLREFVDRGDIQDPGFRWETEA